MEHFEIHKCPTSILVTKEPTTACGCHFARFFDDGSVECLLSQEVFDKLMDCWLEKYGKCPFLVDIKSYLDKERCL